MTMCMKWCPNVHSGTLNSFWILSLMLLAVFIWAITLNVRELITCAKGHRENRSVFVLCWICWNEWSHSKSYFVWPLRYANLWPHHKGTTYHCSPHRRPAVAACTVSLSTCCLMHCTWVIALYFLITGLNYDFSIIYTWVLYPLREMDMGHMTSQIEVIPLSLAAITDAMLWNKLYRPNTRCMPLNINSILFWLKCQCLDALYVLWKHSYFCLRICDFLKRN